MSLSLVYPLLSKMALAWYVVGPCDLVHVEATGAFLICAHQLC